MRIFRLYFIVFLSIPNTFANTADALAIKKQQLHNVQQISTDKQSSHNDLQQKVSSLRTQLQQDAQLIQKQETIILQLEQDISHIQTQKQTLNSLLRQANMDLGSLISITQQIDKHKNIALFLSPDTPKNSMMALRLLQHIMPQIQQKRLKIMTTYDKLSTLQTQILDKQTQILQQKQHIQKSRADLSVKITSYNNMLHRDADIIAQLQHQHRTLQQQVSQLEHIFQQAKNGKTRLNNRHIRPEKIRLFPLENTPITPPVIGTLIDTFEQPLQNGNISDGISIKTLPNAQVVAPFDGYVAYVGAFQSLGKIVLIAHERGYNSVLIGFENIFVQNNDWVLEKDPIGTTNAQGNPFKIEIRYGTKAENPLLWISESIN